MRSTALTLLASVGLIIGGLWLFQDRLLFFPSRDWVQTPDDQKLDYEDVYLDTEDGETLHAWWVPAEDAQGTLLFFHGNAGNVSHRLDSLRIFNDLGLNVLILDYRGYGRSTGSPDEEGLYLDAQASLDWLLDNQVSATEDILLFGRSLGAPVAAWLGQHHVFRGIILESGFTSVPDMGAEHYPFLPVRWLARHDFDAEQAIRNAQSPVLVVHSPDDEIVPFSHGEALYEAAPGDKTFLQLEGDHNRGFLISGEHYRQGLADFLDSTRRD